MSDSNEKKTPVAEIGTAEATTEDLGSSFTSKGWLSSFIADKPTPVLHKHGNSGNSMDDGLFVDHDFPMGDMLLQPAMEWRRPKDICPSAQFIVDGATRMDVCQGVLNDCWFLSAVASLSLHRPLLERVVPNGQSFQEGYNGSFYFQFWQYGEWEKVKVDDLLPTQKGKLIYLCSSEKREFWSALLEKAYAKLKGGYRALNMGFPHEAMVDMTGGITEVLTVASLPKDLAAFLKPILAKGALINCANCQGPLEQRNEFGILFRHAYSVTGLENVKTKYETVELVRVHNPWGKIEWEGPWSDMNGPEWSHVREEEQKRLDRVQKEDGEFWMAVSDFRQNFESMEVCHLSEETLSEPGATQRPWNCTMHHGSWVPHISAGGSPKGGWFWQNPQFHLTLLEEDDDPSDPELTCSFLVALMQKHQRLRGVHLGIGLDIYKAGSECSYLSSLDLSLRRPLISTQGYAQRTEVVIRGRLAPGHYVIIPSTADTNQQGEFILRVLTEKGNNATPAEKPGTEVNSPTQISLLQPSFPHLSALPSPEATRQLFKKHRNKKGECPPLELLNLLTEAIKGGVLAGSEKKLVLEHCKSFVVLVDSRGLAQLDWQGFQALWDKIRKWTDIFLTFDKNKSQLLEYPEVSPALKAAGMGVDDFVLQLIGLRYTEPDMTISYPGFLYLLMKLDSMIHKFQAYDIVGMGTISVSYRQWLHMTMYN
ncbi:calpain-9 isoform X1 [Salvelinus alpinus]|uniref:calpain-9 isoform X1 n=2 Tax=Salvelinus alpinus TaxID=8036 RepID=UPI0039FDC9A5